MGDKVLTNENQIISNTNRIAALELAQEKAQNPALFKTVDNLDQTSHNANMFVAGLSPDQATKEEFVAFYKEKLEIPAKTDDITTIIKIPSEREELYKFMFNSHRTREMYYKSRKALKTCPDVWFRDDLIRKRDHGQGIKGDVKT